MKAQELRVGNLLHLYDNRDGLPFYAKLTGITNNGKLWFVNNPINEECAWDLNDIKPIPITEDILLKCGFNKQESERWCDRHEEYEECDYYYLGCFKLYYNPELGYYTDDTFEYTIKLEYLHQLQNLIHALTGEELTVNL